MPERPLNATAASLLGFLHDGPMTGWDLLEHAQQRIGAFWSLTQSQVYRELAAMASAGLVRAGARGRRDRQPYEITDAGRTAFAAWALKPPADETIRFPLLLTVLFGRHLPPPRLAEHLATHRATHAARLDEYEQVAAALPDGADDVEPYAVATLRFGVAYERAVLEWFDTLPQALRSGATAPDTDA
ncbi:helix-turn-helix transcriptional regulator [Micromonospora sp. WMMD998]|uniref:PadR family transcriptional regulator n=1 Tax=Micromonospora sp. WMMD998 TaxID=3016092 RepID=UPI00249B342B|nr:helix-turn-helix transcriptional regulator [Micromonospora sp. WMMD998]WFE38510.1 helix-turn-helix transcriptional regulator [Micromonospora sp. WMMD998]